MLIIARKPKETITIVCPDGTKIVIHNLSANRTQIGIKAPLSCLISRDEHERPHRKP
jgi:sRNA-binding carbon storage regulator CsrA